jgi:SAM-dependent methyltransferase
MEGREVTSSASDFSIYDDPEFGDTDVGSLMRRGHPDIVAGDEHIVAQVREMRAAARRDLHFLDVGSGSGDLTKLITESVEGVAVTAVEPAAGPADQARQKLRGNARADVFMGRFEDWSGKTDGIISWGSHHHLPHDYLSRVATLIGPTGAFLVGDEFSPEYLDDADVDRLSRSKALQLLDGYIFDDELDVAAYRRDGTVSAWALGLEERRRRALWEWYKYVGDFAIECGEWDVLITELAIARNDFITRYGGEHKTSPRLLERELKLAGMLIQKKFVVGQQPLALRSFVIYTCRVAP